MADCYIGEIRLFAGDFAPMGWLICDGSTQNITTYENLYTVIGTTYGGNGSSTFCLPDLQGRVAVGAGNGPGLTPRPLGSKGGAESVTLVATDTAAHAHPLMVSAATCPNPALPSPQGKALGVGNKISSRAKNPYGTLPAGSTPGSMAPVEVGTSPATQVQAHPNLQPFLPLRYIIAYDGLYPPRD